MDRSRYICYIITIVPLTRLSDGIIVPVADEQPSSSYYKASRTRVGKYKYTDGRCNSHQSERAMPFTHAASQSICCPAHPPPSDSHQIPPPCPR